MSSQLNLLDAFDESIVIENANILIDMLNDGLPKKDLYYGNIHFKYKGLWVLMAQNKNKDAVFNILDDKGKTPNGFNACWRSINHIKHEINRCNGTTKS